MSRKRNPWPDDLDIHPKNNPLFLLLDEHPAKRAIILQAACRRDCASREIPWPGREEEAFDQAWVSTVDGRPWTFSGLIYAAVSFTFIQSEWLTHPPEITSGEQRVLGETAGWLKRLDECRQAAESQQNTRVLDLIPKAEAFFLARQESVVERLRVDGLLTTDH